MAAVLCNDEDPVVWDAMNPDTPESKDAKDRLRAAMADSDSTLYAHNVGFEIAVSRYRLMEDMGIKMSRLERYRCTMAMCRRASVPPSLAEASKFLRLGEAKDKAGKALIAIFSDQNRIVTIHKGKEKMKVASPLLVNPVPWDWIVKVAGEDITIAEAWHRFKAYCGQDAVVEREVHKALVKFELSGSELDGFLFDLRMNDRGVPVNMPALLHAQTFIEQHQKDLIEQFEVITRPDVDAQCDENGEPVYDMKPGLAPSQTAKVLAWLKNEGYPGDNLQAATMEEFLGCEGMTDRGRRALSIRADLSFAATKKISAMIQTACPDNYMRGLFIWYGAQKTGRWTSSGPQLQNAKKPTISCHREAYQDICDGLDFEMFKVFYGNPYEAVASCVRNFLKPHQGKLLDADYANIESRMAALLAGQESMLDAYREGRDLYKELASVIFNVPLDKVTKEQRFVAKTASLACVFGTGAKTFHETCAMWGMPIEKKLACHTVRVFRNTNPEFPKTWKKFELAAISAINSPGGWFKVNEFVSFGYSRSKPFPRLIMKIASGRCLTYPHAKLERRTKRHTDYETGETREWESTDIMFWGSRQGYAGWGWVNTSGPDLFQSATQGSARDVLQHGCVNAERRGYEIMAVIHDQALGFEGCPTGFIEALCQHPEWLPKDFPLVAEGGLVDCYDKG